MGSPPAFSAGGGVRNAEAVVTCLQHECRLRGILGDHEPRGLRDRTFAQVIFPRLAALHNSLSVVSEQTFCCEDGRGVDAAEGTAFGRRRIGELDAQ